jgi:hypothetical protein
MKTQQLITGSNQVDFERDLNRELNEGATIVPGTLLCSLCVVPIAAYSDAHGATRTERHERWAVVIEK